MTVGLRNFDGIGVSLTMLGYLARRILYAIPIAFGVSVLCFSLVYIAPGDPLQNGAAAGRDRRDDRHCEARIRLRQTAAGAVRDLSWAMC